MKTGESIAGSQIGEGKNMNDFTHSSKHQDGKYLLWLSLLRGSLLTSCKLVVVEEAGK